MKHKWKADAYASNSKGQEIWAKELIEKMHLQGCETILDIGCGDGKITNYLAGLTTSQVTGIDLSHDMIAFAKKSFVKPRFIQMGAEDLKFDSEFDLIFSNAALHWVKDHDAVVRGIYKALKPGGKILLQMGGKGNAFEVFKALEFVKKEYVPYFKDFISPYTFHCDTYYIELLRNIGFESFDATLIPKEMVHQNIDDFKGWLETTWFPFLDCVPKVKRETFLNQWIQTYLDLTSLHDQGPISVSMIRLEVTAQK
ncbi:MAG: methyltransferase domain-containing protein [Sulfurospirillaceae bacterium]|nr:methyltransferase domain-containing protein [Sulfurospirillaceae bacterium]